MGDHSLPNYSLIITINTPRINQNQSGEVWLTNHSKWMFINQHPAKKGQILGEGVSGIGGEGFGTPASRAQHLVQLSHWRSVDVLSIINSI